MKYYDARIIEGCCVFSYTVDTPESETEKNIPAQKKSNEKQKQQKNSMLLEQVYCPLSNPILQNIILPIHKEI